MRVAAQPLLLRASSAFAPYFTAWEREFVARSDIQCNRDRGAFLECR
jgi:hypothetical protein